MTMSSGFFDSVGHDRRYTAHQWGQIMDYLIRDGVYYRYPETGVENDANGNPNTPLTPFDLWVCTSNDAYFNPNGPAIAIGPGRAWFDHTWTWVQTPEFVALPPNDANEDRVDLIVLTMDQSTPVRENYFRVIQGDPYSTYEASDGYSKWKELGKLQGVYMHDDEVHDVPIAKVKRRTDETTNPITNDDVTSLVGWDQCPYVTNIAADKDGSTGILSTEALFSKWQRQWSEFIAEAEEEYGEFFKLFGDSENLWKQEWGSFLNKRSADFMAWLKMYDRAYHTWYQGSVNWTYEYIRNLQAEEQEFSKQWADAIQKAQDLLENGFTEYTQKIDEILKRFESIDSLVDDKMAELQQEVDTAISELKTKIQNDTKEMISEVVTEQIGTIVNQVVEQAAPDIREALAAEVENMVKSEVDASFEDRLADLEKRLEAYQQETLDSLNRSVDQVVASYTDFQNKVETNIQQLVYDSIGDAEDLQAALEGVVDRQLQAAVLTALGNAKQEWTDAIKEDVASQISSEVERIFSERFESEKESLLQYVKDQQKPITDAAVDERIDEKFTEKQAELEGVIEQKVDEAVETKLSDIGQNIWDYVDLDALAEKLIANEKFKQEVPTVIDLSNYLERG